MNTDNKERKPSLWYIVFLTILTMALIVGLVVYIVFGIVYLIEDYYVSNECKGSNLWAYVLVSIILSTLNIGIKKNRDEKLDITITKFLIVGIFNLALVVWGGIELWKNSYSCDDLFNSNLWKFGLSSFIFQVFSCLILLLVPPILLFYLTLYENRLTSTKLENNQKNGIENDLNLRINTDV